jgi:hypothetical protein
MARPRNPNAAPKKEATGRKYIVLPAEEWETFVNGREFYQSKDAALTAADNFAKDADDTQPGIQHRFAIVEEAGFLASEVQKAVKRSFSSSRKGGRRSNAAIAADASQGATEGAEVSEDAQETATASEPQNASEHRSRKSRR